MPEYSLHDYGSMIRDRVRMDAYVRALEQVVAPDSVVLDIGTGFGILALLAARLDARRVFAVEEGEIAELARELAVANGCADRIEVIRGLSTKIELPERADVIVSDLRGVLPLHGDHIPSIADARARHLVPGGALIPLRDTLWAAPTELEAAYSERVSWWAERSYGFDLSPGRAFGANRWWQVRAPAEALLATAAQLATLDYRSISNPNVQSTAEWKVARIGRLHGIAVWFETELAEGATFTNAPGEADTIYGQAFFPVADPVDLVVGDRVSLAFWASPVDGEYVFRWNTRVDRLSNPTREIAAFSQSTLFSFPLSPKTLAVRRGDFVPSPAPESEAVACVLERADGRRTLADLSQVVERRFPELFRSSGEALGFVTELTQKYGR